MSSWDKCCQHGVFNRKNATTPQYGRTQNNYNKSSKSEDQERTRSEDGECRRSIETKSLLEAPRGPIAFMFDNAKREDNEYEKKQNPVCQLSFNEMGLHANLLKGIKAVGFSHPHEVQKEVLSYFSERDYIHMVVTAPIKSGKTSAILLWVFNKLLQNQDKVYPKALMLCPTHEIAEAAYTFAEQISKHCETKVIFAVKGKNLKKGEKLLADLVIATPDKILDLQYSYIDLKNVKFLIFDEAHFMSSTVGHLKAVTHICSKLSSRCGIIISTLCTNIVLEDFIGKYLNRHNRIEVESSTKKPAPKEVFVTYRSNEERFNALMGMEIFKSKEDQTVIFCETRDAVKELESLLQAKSVRFGILIGGKSVKMSERDFMLQQFKENKIKVLITTNSFVKAIESDNVRKIINHDPILNKVHHLNLEIYDQHANLLNPYKKCLVINFIPESWEFHLLTQSKVERLSENATVIQAEKIMNGQVVDY